MKHTKPKVLILTGIPGSGKSSVADEVSRKLPLCAHLQTDYFRKLVKGGYVSPQQWNDQVEQQYHLARKNVCAVANNFLSSGFSVIIDDTVWERRLLEEYRDNLRTKNVWFVLLKPSLQEALRRNNTRSVWNLDATLLEQSQHLFEKEHMEHVASLVIDSTHQTVAETVHAVLQHIGRDHSRLIS